MHTVLIVDDEERILTALRRCLRSEGYEILTAESPDDALELLGKRGVDLVLSDEKMPAMSGLEFLAVVARRWPATVRLLITGWTESVPQGELECLGVKALISKPWDNAELKQTLRRALEDPRG